MFSCVCVWGVCVRVGVCGFVCACVLCVCVWLGVRVCVSVHVRACVGVRVGEGVVVCECVVKGAVRKHVFSFCWFCWCVDP